MSKKEWIATNDALGDHPVGTKLPRLAGSEDTDIWWKMDGRKYNKDDYPELYSELGVEEIPTQPGEVEEGVGTEYFIKVR
ncbi:tail fiber protein [Pectobacterium brasiliense]|uniref:tail fiber protein n=1 Tax=Pectobacterium brasiliense TaxID=180957 RepID=UPI001969D1F6|nr:tail fiber protein [Pectobacterium brasiliense]MBN3093499.1 tail fiber protein [Pectobacterium brasiliense]